MARLVSLMIVLSLVLTVGVFGCGKKPPEPTGEAFEPPRELDEMKNQMFEAYKKGQVNKAQ